MRNSYKTPKHKISREQAQENSKHRHGQQKPKRSRHNDQQSHSQHGRNHQSRHQQNHDRFLESSDDRIIMGIHSVKEAINVRPKAIKQIWLKQDFLNNPSLKQIAETAKAKNIKVLEKADQELKKIAESHQGVAAFVTENPQWKIEEWSQQEHCTLLALDSLEDPQNVGAIFRSSWLFGVQGILMCSRRAANITPSVAKVAEGGLEHVAWEIVDQLPQALEELKEKGFWVFGLDASGQKDLYEIKVPEKVIWVLGAEDSGIRKSVQGICDELVRIPQLDKNASLNVSAAGAVTLGETFRQRRLSFD